MNQAADTPAIETRGLTKRYGRHLGCQGISLTVPAGQVYGLLGPNGAGKSTLVKMLLGLLQPTAGTAALFGLPPAHPAARRRIGYLPELFRFQDWATATEVLGFHAALSRLPHEAARRRIPEALARVGLEGHGERRVRAFSKGMQQRLGLAVALLTDPDLIFLDEPTSALDPLGRRHVRQIVQELKAAGKAVFLNSHLLSEVEMVCDRVAVIKGGRLMVEGRLEDLLAPRMEVELRLGTDPWDARHTPAQEVLRDVAWATVASDDPPRVETAGDGTSLVRLNVKSRGNIPPLVDAVVQAGGQVYEVRSVQRSLEDLFVELMEGDGV